MNDKGNPQESKAQDEVFAFLADPMAYGGRGVVRRIDTHAASVFLAGDRVLKVKRAVRFPFLDYSTLEKRKAAAKPRLQSMRPTRPTSIAVSSPSPANPMGSSRSAATAKRSNGRSI
jgi:hypothetical protein